MATYFDVTSANAAVILQVETLYPSGVKLEGFGADAMLSVDGVDNAEYRRGADGRGVAGVVKNPITVQITLEANSPGLDVITTVWQAMQSNNKPYECTLTVSYPATGRTVTFVRGVLSNVPPTPAAQKTLQPVQATFIFEHME